ncbi:MAG: anthranilate synthase component I [Actinomycetota bacterium]|nr:anthranilate synthase component I [Actinomycetota bacterium]
MGVRRTTERVGIEAGVESIVDRLDSRLGVLLASRYEYPGRYTRWDIGFADPPLMVTSRDRAFRVEAVNARGQVLLPAVERALAATDAVAGLEGDDSALTARIAEPAGRFPEEERSRQPSVFSALRAIIDLFRSPDDPHHGLYGAFGYDLAFQFEPIERRLRRPADQRDMVLFVPDELVVVDHNRHLAERHSYEFELEGASTAGLPREGPEEPYRGTTEPPPARSDHERGEFADLVRKSHEAFRRGDLFEVVPGQTFFAACPDRPSEVFRRLRERNPAPFAALMNLGEREYLVGASPEMFVRVEGSRVETCPISGTIARGDDVLSDADQILELLNSAKDTAELTMCTDVDRNDKSRICEPGSVRILGRRQIEVYSRVIHTVDHVEGRLREGFDALDAFLTHAWAVTVTGAPKVWAMRFIEENERSPRGWYGGAIGYVGFAGGMNTGLTLRTSRIKDGVAEVRAGATLLIDSDPDEEERETELKAAAFLDALRRPLDVNEPPAGGDEIDAQAGAGRRILLVDYEDSFVHTLANYLRQTGAEVTTVRGADADAVAEALAELEPDLVFLSPGPGTPADFDVGHAIGLALERELPVFGVCLGLQALVEHFGGKLDLLDYPVHGKSSVIDVRGGWTFEGLPQRFEAGRYHSIHAAELPPELTVTAESDDGVVMGVEHSELPVAAVQFHPESLMTTRRDVGLRLIENVVRRLARERPPSRAPRPYSAPAGRRTPR